jgi:CelD/BcsL family acetyltransferase involved in cellulose biosynthesis
VIPRELPRAEGTARGRITIEGIDPTTDPRWLALLEAGPGGLFHSPPWLRALAEAYGFTVRAYCATDIAGEALGGVAFCEIADALGRRLVSVPFSDVCDPLVSSPDVWDALFTRLQAHGAPIHLRCLDQGTAWNDERLAVTKRARWHTLSLRPAPEALWDGLDGSTQRALRRAERAGVVIRPLEGAAGLREFLALHVTLRKRKYRLLAQPPAFFEAMARHFDEIAGWFPLGAFLGERLIAATIYLRWSDTLYYKFNASALDALHVRPNSLLIWAGMLLGRALGCRVLDLGPSDDDQPGLIRFKGHFGAEERELRFLRYAPPGWPDERAAEARRRLGRLTAALTAPDVPDEVTARAGTLLYRLFA